MIEHIVGRIESYPLRLAAGLGVMALIPIVFGIGVGLFAATVALVLQMFGLPIE